jgi:SAM-dependent methyltransferase
MTGDDATKHMRELAQVYSDWAISERLSESLDPRGLDLLEHTAARYLRARDRMLDIGCRDAGYLTRLVPRHGCTGVGLDPLARHATMAVAKVREADLAHAIAVERGVIEHLPHEDATFDFIWCRDVLALVHDLQAGMRECARVLKPGGHMLAYCVFATERLEPREAAMMNGALSNRPENMVEARMEAAIEAAGLRIALKDVVSTEWREYEEEREKPASEELLQLARLRRNRDALVAEFGEHMYRMAEASAHWLPYILLGKLLPVMYVLEHEAAQR